MADIDIVCVNYRTDEDLKTFSTSLQHADDVDFRFYVMDVAPENGSLVVGNVLQVFKENVGYGKAANFGASLGKAPLVGIFNADVAFPQGQLRKIVDAMETHPHWHVLGPRQVNSLGEITHAGYIGSNKRPMARAWRQPVGSKEWSDTIACNYVMGSAFFVRREVWDELTDCVHNPWAGAFLESPLYFEETWACYHARAHGFRVIYYGEATLIHEWHGSIRATHTQDEESRKMEQARSMFMHACDAHGIEH